MATASWGMAIANGILTLKNMILRWGCGGEIKDNIRYDGYIHYNRYDHAVDGHTFINEPVINAAIESGDYNLQNPLSDDERHRAAIRESSVQSERKYEDEHLEAGVSLDGPLF